jgi:hypothetical protein
MTLKCDLLPAQHAQHIAQVLIGPNFPYYFGANIHNGSLTDKFDGLLSTSGFSHRFYDNHEQHSDGLNLVMPYLWALLHRYNCQMKELYRVRAFMSLPSNEQHNGFPHVDIPNFCAEGLVYKTAIVYVLGTDGETIFYKDRFNGDAVPDTSNMTESHRITPIPNSGVMFDGDVYHTALLPQTSKVRLVLNFNFAVVSND